MWHHPGNFRPFEKDAPIIRPNEAGNEVHKCGFAGTIGSDDADGLTLAQLEGDAFRSSNASKVLGKILHFQDKRSRHQSTSTHRSN